MKFLVCLSIFFSIPCWAKKHDFKPLYSKCLHKKSSFKVSKKVKETTKKDKNILPAVTVPQEENSWASFIPEIPNDVAKKIKDLTKERQTSEQSKTISYYENPQEQAKLNYIKEELLKHYIEKQIIQKKIIDKAKEGSTMVKSVNDTVEAVSGNTSLQVEASDNFKMGTKTDILRQKSEIWMESTWFKSEAKVLYPSFREANYLVSISRSFDFKDMEFIPLMNLSSSVAYDGIKEDVTSTVKTQLIEDLELTYQNLLKNKQDSVSLNYNISF